VFASARGEDLDKIRNGCATVGNNDALTTGVLDLSTAACPATSSLEAIQEEGR
jgi:hypothetical protein